MMALSPAARAKRLALERQSGKEMQASRDARNAGDHASAKLYRKRAQMYAKQSTSVK